MMRTLIVCLFSAWITIPAIAQDTAPDLQTVQREIRNTWDAFIEMWEKREPLACAAFYTMDAINVPPESPIYEGRDAIGEFYTRLFDAYAAAKYTHDILALDVYAGGAVEYGGFQVVWTRKDGTPFLYEARSITHWEDHDDEGWKIKRFMFNNPPK